MKMMPRAWSKRRALAWSISLAAVLAATAQAAPIQVVPTSINMVRDTRAANNVGIPQGDAFQFDANVVGGSGGTLSRVMADLCLAAKTLRRHRIQPDSTRQKQAAQISVVS